MRQEIKSLPVIVLAISSLLLLPVFIYPSDWAGWLLVYFSFVLPLLFSRVRRDRKLLMIFFIIIAAHNAVSIYNVYGSTIYGAALDAATFQERAKELALNKHPIWFAEFDALEVGMNVYTRFLAGFYRIFGDSLLLGQTLSVIAYTLSCLIIVYATSLLRFKSRRAIIIIYGLSASAVIFCSVTMREAWQVLFFLLTLYLSLQLRVAPSLFKAVCISLSGLALGLLHNGLFVYSLALVGWSLYWGASGRWKDTGYKKALIRTGILVTASIVFGGWLYVGGEIGGISGAIRSGEVMNYTETYRERGEQDAAANYQVRVDGSSPITLALSGSLAFVYYQFAPFPWQVRRVIDVYAALEALLRFLLILYMLKLWWRARGEQRQRYTYLMLSYISLEFLWSLGTANWGTAIRHHIIAYGPLVLLGTPGLVYRSERLLMRLNFRVRKSSRLKRYDWRGIKAIG